MRFVLSRRASVRIDEIIRYTDDHFGPVQTETYLEGLYTAFQTLTEHPRLGREWAKEKRRYQYRSHYIFYRLENNRVFITDIRHVRMSLPDE